MTPRTVLADGAFLHLPAILHEFSTFPLVVIAGQHSYHHSGASRRLAEVLGEVKAVFYIDSKQPNLAGLSRFRHLFGRDPHCLIAIGGGHVIDAAKLISTGAADPQDVRNRLANRELFRRVMPLIAVPTTPGSGSEVTPFAVIYIDGVKYSIDHPSLKPDAALIDPALMASLGKRQIAASGLDAISQSIEALLSRRADTDSDRFARASLSLGWSTLPKLYSTGEPVDFATMAEAANLAGEAIAITRTTLPHALSYYFTERFDVLHGHAVALSMGQYLSLLGERMRNGSYALERWQPSYDFILTTMGVESSDGVAERWATYMGALDLKSSPAQLGIGSDDLSAIHGAINADRLANAPITLSASEIDRLWSPSSSSR